MRDKTPAAGFVSRPFFQLTSVGLLHMILLVHRGEWPVVAMSTGLLAALVVLYCRGWVCGSVATAYSAVVISVMSDLDIAFPPAILVLLIPMLFLARDLPDLRRVLAYGVWIGFLIAAGATSWLWEVMTRFWEYKPAFTMLIYGGVSAEMGLEFAVFMVLARWLSEKSKLNLVLVAPIAHCVMEFWLPVPFPMRLSMPTAWTPVMFQVADLIGMPGVSFLIAVENCALFSMVDGCRPFRLRRVVYGSVAALAVIGVWFGYGAWALRHYADKDSAGGMGFAVVQPMSPLKILNADTATKRSVAQELARMSEEAVTSSPVRVDLLIWPEGAAPFSFTTPTFNPEFVELIRSFQKDHPVAMTFQDVEFRPGDERHAVRYYNHVTAIGPDGAYLGGYRKNHPLPFAEYLPGEAKLPWLRRLFPKARTVLPGEEPTLLPSPGGAFAPLVCYEVLETDYVRRFVSMGAGFMINYTNDGYYGDTQQPLQHLLFAVFRAVENRRPVIRATNTGISALIDSRGVMAPDSRTGVMERAILHGTVHPREGQTFYGRWGDWLPRLIVTPAFLALVGWVVAGPRIRRRLGRDAGATERVLTEDTSEGARRHIPGALRSRKPRSNRR